MNITKNLGMLLLGIWLIITGLSTLLAFAVPSPIMAIIALLAGILILLGR